MPFRPCNGEDPYNSSTLGENFPIFRVILCPRKDCLLHKDMPQSETPSPIYETEGGYGLLFNRFEDQNMED